MKNHTIIIAAFMLLLIPLVFMLVIYPGYVTSETSGHLLADDDFDVTEIRLSSGWETVPDDISANAELDWKQNAFIDEMGLPKFIPPWREDKINRKSYRELDREYRQKLRELEGHPFRNLYRQLAAARIVQGYCGMVNLSKVNLEDPDNAWLYYLREMTRTGTNNATLIYASYVRLQHYNSRESLCRFLDEMIPHYDLAIKEEQEFEVEFRVVEEYSGWDFIEEQIRKDLIAHQQQLNRLKQIRKALNKH